MPWAAPTTTAPRPWEILATLVLDIPLPVAALQACLTVSWSQPACSAARQYTPPRLNPASTCWAPRADVTRPFWMTVP